jgi:hypothetical protein
VGFLAVSAVALVAAVHVRSDKRSDGFHELSGSTAQGRAMEFQVDEDGRPWELRTRVEARCSWGEVWQVRWRSENGPGVPFSWDGRRLQVRMKHGYERDDGYHERARYRLWARRAGDGTLDGAMRITFRVEWDRKLAGYCDSPWVRFAAGGHARRRLARATAR